jgi:hypothetical protein
VALQKMFVFSPEDLVNLLVHYTDGMVPLEHTITNVGFNPMLSRFIGIEVESEEWDCEEALHLRYDGKKTMSWTHGDRKEHPVWEERNETPTRQ